jgi:MutS domain V
MLSPAPVIISSSSSSAPMRPPVTLLHVVPAALVADEENTSREARRLAEKLLKEADDAGATEPQKVTALTRAIVSAHLFLRPFGKHEPFLRLSEWKRLGATTSSTSKEQRSSSSSSSSSAAGLAIQTLFDEGTTLDLNALRLEVPGNTLLDLEVLSSSSTSSASSSSGSSSLSSLLARNGLVGLYLAYASTPSGKRLLADWVQRPLGGGAEGARAINRRLQAVDCLSGVQDRCESCGLASNKGHRAAVEACRVVLRFLRSPLVAVTGISVSSSSSSDNNDEVGGANDDDAAEIAEGGSGINVGTASRKREIASIKNWYPKGGKAKVMMEAGLRAIEEANREVNEGSSYAGGSKGSSSGSSSDIAIPTLQLAGSSSSMDSAQRVQENSASAVASSLLALYALPPPPPDLPAFCGRLTQGKGSHEDVVSLFSWLQHLSKAVRAQIGDVQLKELLTTNDSSSPLLEGISRPIARLLFLPLKELLQLPGGSLSAGSILAPSATLANSILACFQQQHADGHASGIGNDGTTAGLDGSGGESIAEGDGFAPFSSSFELRNSIVSALRPGIVKWQTMLRGSQEGLERELQNVRAILKRPNLQWSSLRTGVNSSLECIIEIRKAEEKSFNIPQDWSEVSQTKELRRFSTPTTLALLRQRELSLGMIEGEKKAAWSEWQRRCFVDTPIVQALMLPLSKLIAHLDALACLASVSRLPNYSRPVILEPPEAGTSRGPFIRLLEGRHPVLEHLGRNAAVSSSSAEATSSSSSFVYIPSTCCLGGPGGPPGAAASGRGAGVASGEAEEDDGNSLPPWSPPVLIITGPNAAGKSFVSRMIGSLVLQAHLGSYCSAERVKVTVLDSLQARIGNTSSDAITSGLSSFGVEMSQAARMLTVSKGPSSRPKHCLLLIDELGKHTSTHDGAAIAGATVRYFADQWIEAASSSAAASSSSHNATDPSFLPLAVFVSHFLELTRIPEEGSEVSGGTSSGSDAHSTYKPFVGNAHMGFATEGEVESSNASSGSGAPGDPFSLARGRELTFLYRLTEDAASSSYGLQVSRRAGLPKSIVRRAAEIAAQAVAATSATAIAPTGASDGDDHDDMGPKMVSSGGLLEEA